MSQQQWGVPQQQWGFPQQQWGFPQHQFPQQQSAGPAGPLQPGRGRNPLKLLALALGGVALVALLGLVAASLLVKPAEVAYQNDDYQVPPAELNPPPIPVPATLEQAREWTTANALYAQQTPAPVRCGIEPLDVAAADDAALKAHFELTMECLVRVWQPPLTKAGFQVFRPTVTIYTDQITTKCGSGDMSHNAFYCGADQQVYWSNTLGADLAPFSVDRWAGDEVMAHEFGHAIQGRSGILASKNWLRSEAASEAVALELARRNETQADCLAGMFLRSVSRALGFRQSDVQIIEDNFASSGDDTIAGKAPGTGNHGQSGTRRYWGSLGLGAPEVSRCNTYTAQSNLVR